MLGLGAALTVTITAAVIGFSAGNGGSSDSVLTIGDNTVPSTDGGRPRVGDNTTTTAQVTSTTGPAATTSAPSSTTTAPTTTAPPQTAPEPTTTTAPGDPGDDDVSRPPPTLGPPGGGDDDDGPPDDEPEQVTMPDVYQWRRDDAVRELESLGLRVNVRSQHAWGDWWRGRVMDQSPSAGESVDENGRVTIWVGDY